MALHSHPSRIRVTGTLVQLCEDGCTSELFQSSWEEGEGILELYGNLVNNKITNARTQASVLLDNKEKTGSSSESRRSDIYLLKSLLFTPPWPSVRGWTEDKFCHRALAHPE